MCQSYRKHCACGEGVAEIFFGKMVLDEGSVQGLYCPKCSRGVERGEENRVWDNGWILELSMDVLRNRAPLMGISPEAVTASWVFDEGYATWVGLTPDDFERREAERSEIQKLAKTDLRAYIAAFKEWGRARERRLVEEGWRKVSVKARKEAYGS